MSEIERRRLKRLTKAELIDLVFELRALPAPEVDCRRSAVDAVRLLETELRSQEDVLPAAVEVELASAFALAEAISSGPEMARAGLVKQLQALVERLRDFGSTEPSIVELIRLSREKRQSEL